MLVVAATPEADALRWSGRRHDDDGPAAVSGGDVQALFDEVFHALHDGEQVAVGFPAPLGIAPIDDVPAALEQAERDVPAVRELCALLNELGRFRPWTVASTSLPRWRATTSVLLWETDDGDLNHAVETFFGLAEKHADRGAEEASGTVVNLAAAAAMRADLTVDAAQLHEPVVRVSAGS